MDLSLGCTDLILSKCEAHGLLRNQAAYVLATAYHETAHTMQPIEEIGSASYLKGKPYYPYVGRGFVQLTWKANYQKASRELGVDFTANPQLLLQPDYSADILVIGMADGWFTGKKLSDYITLQRSNFTGARKVVNGVDRAEMIAGYAEAYDDALKAVGYGGEPVAVDHPVDAPAEPAPSSGGLLAALLSLLKSILGALK